MTILLPGNPQHGHRITIVQYHPSGSVVYELVYSAKARGWVRIITDVTLVFPLPPPSTEEKPLDQ